MDEKIKEANLFQSFATVGGGGGLHMGPKGGQSSSLAIHTVESRLELCFFITPFLVFKAKTIF